MSDSPEFAPQPSSHYRLVLRVITKLLLAAAVLVMLYVFLSAFLSGDGNEAAVADKRVAVGSLAPGESMIFTWETRPIIIYRRRAAEQAGTGSATTELLDPRSERSQQPGWAMSDTRSRTPEWFVAIAVGTDFSCPITWVPAGGEFRGSAWRGGFEDSCRGSRYDAAGRVYADQYATKNLIIPHYQVDGDSIVLGAR